MQKILILLILGMFFGCSEESYETGGETVSDGLIWHDVVEPFFITSEGAGGSFTHVDGKYIEADISNTNGSNAKIAMVEFDDDKDYVGTERGRIVEGDQPYVLGFNPQPSLEYIINVKKGDDITEEQFKEAIRYDDYYHPPGGEVIWIYSQFYSFDFRNITGHENIPIGAILAELEVYHISDMNKSVGSFYIVL